MDAEPKPHWGLLEHVFQTQVDQEEGREHLHCPWFIHHHCQGMGMMLDKEHSIPLTA